MCVAWLRMMIDRTNGGLLGVEKVRSSLEGAYSCTAL